MSGTLIIGCGNTLRGDDGLGWWMAGRVAEQFAGPEVKVLLEQRLTPELAEAVSGAETVLFLDCSAGAAPGEVTLLPVEAAAEMPRMLTHHLEPAELLRLGCELYGRVPSRAYLITVGGESFDLGEQLSEAVSEAAPAVLTLVECILRGAAA